MNTNFEGLPFDIILSVVFLLNAQDVISLYKVSSKFKTILQENYVLIKLWVIHDIPIQLTKTMTNFICHMTFTSLISRYSDEYLDEYSDGYSDEDFDVDSDEDSNKDSYLGFDEIPVNYFLSAFQTRNEEYLKFVLGKNAIDYPVVNWVGRTNSIHLLNRQILNNHDKCLLITSLAYYGWVTSALKMIDEVPFSMLLDTYDLTDTVCNLCVWLHLAPESDRMEKNCTLSLCQVLKHLHNSARAVDGHAYGSKEASIVSNITLYFGYKHKSDELINMAEELGAEIEHAVTIAVDRGDFTAYERLIEIWLPTGDPYWMVTGRIIIDGSLDMIKLILTERVCFTRYLKFAIGCHGGKIRLDVVKYIIDFFNEDEEFKYDGILLSRAVGTGNVELVKLLLNFFHTKPTPEYCEKVIWCTINDSDRYNVSIPPSIE